MGAGTEGNKNLYAQYTQQLVEYPPHFGSSEKCDAPKPLVGWKIHLNVNPQNVAIVARFALQMNDQFIGNSCYKGIPFVKFYDEEDLESSHQDSIKMLQNVFGDYFGGGLTYYQPDQSMILPGEDFEHFLQRTTK